MDVAALADMNRTVIGDLRKLAAQRDRGAVSSEVFELRRSEVLRSAVPGPPVDPRVAPFIHGSICAGALEEGVRQEELGNLGDACEQYSAALAIAHPEVSPDAGLYLGSLLLRMNNPSGAHEAWTTAMAIGSTDGAARSALLLGNMLRAQDRKAAQAAYEFALGCRDADAYRAAEQLAELHMERDDYLAAREAIRSAVGLGDSEADRRLARTARAIAEYLRERDAPTKRTGLLGRLINW